MEVRLTAPSWVARGGSATLRCLHQVPPQLLYKVEFMRTGAKLLQYVRERKPPFTSYSFAGGTINMSLTTESSITLDNMDPAASGTYWCEVSLETPIYTAASPPHQLTVVYPQKHPPIITFGDPDVVVGGLLRANCTSAPAAPAPKLTWYIDDVKIEEEQVRYFSYRVSSSTRTKGGGGYKQRKQQHRYIAPELNHTAKYWALVSETTRAPPHSKKCTLHEAQTEEMAKLRKKPRPVLPAPIQLWVSVLELRVPAHGRLQLTCTATIPDQVAPHEPYADVKKQTVTVAVKELPRPYSESTHANESTNVHFSCHIWSIIGMLLMFYVLKD
ncbi:uncharacterized protein LOC105388391 [Plutella xylostella]|uniref:uncharacterized protein LOC105388391 n=1 Tax=Plutella xylostella TaxID=51655 RepID=UPI0020328FE7|nr:uncharacterized protein LOC105388391 [Plutella xylostella]